MRDRIEIQTGTRTPQATGGTAWVTTATETVWGDVAVISAEGRERYQSIDAVVNYKVRLRKGPSVSLSGTRFVWVTNGSKILQPVAPPEEYQTYTTVLCTDTGETA